MASTKQRTIGRDVKVKVQRGEFKTEGRYVGKVQQRANGAWHAVNIAAPRTKPEIRYYRLANITRA